MATSVPNDLGKWFRHDKQQKPPMPFANRVSKQDLADNQDHSRTKVPPSARPSDARTLAGESLPSREKDQRREFSFGKLYSDVRRESHMFLRGFRNTPRPLHSSSAGVDQHPPNMPQDCKNDPAIVTLPHNDWTVHGYSFPSRAGDEPRKVPDPPVAEQGIFHSSTFKNKMERHETSNQSISDSSIHCSKSYDRPTSAVAPAVDPGVARLIPIQPRGQAGSDFQSQQARSSYNNTISSKPAKTHERIRKAARADQMNPAHIRAPLNDLTTDVRKARYHQALEDARKEFEKSIYKGSNKSINAHYKSVTDLANPLRYGDSHDKIDEEQQTFIDEKCHWEDDERCWYLNNGGPIVLRENLFNTIMSYLRSMMLECVEKLGYVQSGPKKPKKCTRNGQVQYFRKHTAGIRPTDVHNARALWEKFHLGEIHPDDDLWGQERVRLGTGYLRLLNDSLRADQT